MMVSVGPSKMMDSSRRKDRNYNNDDAYQNLFWSIALLKTANDMP